MADKYLNLQGLAGVADKVNQKLRTVTTMPSTPELDDVVLYKGATTALYEQGGIYLYKTVKTYYGWSDTTNTFYTESATPATGDKVYSDTIGTDSGFTVTTYDSTNNQIEFNSLLYDRDSDQDTPINKWIMINASDTIYDVQATADKAHMDLTKNEAVKTTLPLVSTFVGTQAEWNQLTAAQQAVFRLVVFTDTNDTDESAKEMICALYEVNPTSTHAYAIGDYFIYNDVLYKATQTIAIGDTIVPDTNCSTTNVTAELLATEDLSGDVEQLQTDVAAAQADIVGLAESVESSTTSAHAYNIGDKFMLNHVEYIATKPINIGDTLDTSNCSSDTRKPFVILEVINDGVKTFGDALTAIRAYLPSVTAYDPRCYRYHINFGNVIDCYYAGYDTNAAWQFSNLTLGSTVETGVAFFNTNIAQIRSQAGNFTSGVMNSPVRLVYVP